MEKQSVTTRRDGLKEQAELLGTLSRKLDEYFLLSSFGSSWRNER